MGKNLPGLIDLNSAIDRPPPLRCILIKYLYVPISKLVQFKGKKEIYQKTKSKNIIL